MKVKDLIQMFNDSYDQDTELMVLWWDSSYRESLAGTWDKSVGAFDNGRFSTFEIDEQIFNFIAGSETELNAELAIDTYLSRKSEEELTQ
jgi:hypothetical protein